LKSFYASFLSRHLDKKIQETLLKTTKNSPMSSTTFSPQVRAFLDAIPTADPTKATLTDLADDMGGDADQIKLLAALTRVQAKLVSI